MTSAKTKNSTRQTTQKALENSRESSELRSEIEDRWIGKGFCKIGFREHRSTFVAGPKEEKGKTEN